MSFQQTTSQQQQQFGTTTDTKQHTETQQTTTGYAATHAQMGTVCSPSQPITQYGQEYQPSYTDTTMAAASTLQSTPQQPVTGVQQGATREQSSYQQQQQGGTFEEQGDRLLQHEKLTGSGYQQTDLQGGGFTSGMPQYQQQLGASSPQQHTATAFGGTSNTVQRTPTEQTQVQPLGFTDTSGFGGMDSTKTTDFQQQQQQVTPQQQTFGDAPTTGFGATRDTAATAGFAGGVTALGTTAQNTAQQEQFGGIGDTAHVEAGETGTHEATGTRHSDSQPLKEVHPQQQQLDEVKGLSGFGAATTTTTTKQSPMPTPTHGDARELDRGAPAPNTKAADQAAVAAIVPQPGHRAVDIHDEPKDIQKFLKKEEKIETKEVKDRDHVEHKAEKKLEKILEKEEKHREKLEKKDEKSDTHVTPLPAAGVQDVTASKDKPSTFTHETTKTPTLQQTPQATTKGITTTTTTGTQPTQFEKAAGGITGLSGIAAMKDATHIQDEGAGQQRQQQQFSGQQTTFGEGEQQTQFQKATGGITTVSGISAIRDSTHIQPGEQEQGQPQFDTQQQTTPQNLTAGEQMQRDQQKIHNAQPAPNEPATQLQQASQKSLQHETTLPREGITPAKEATLTQDQPVSFTPGFSSAGGMGGAIGQRPLQHELTAGIEGGERQQPTQHGPQSAFNDQKVEGFEAAPEHLPVEHTAGIAWFADTTKSAAELSKEAPVIHSPSSIPVDAANPVLRNAPALPPATEAKQPTMTQRDLDKVSTTSTAGGDSGKFVASNLTDPTPQTQQQQAQRG